jgi:hypothetical protein
MNFGEAIEALKTGLRVSRQGWNGKNMWLSLVKESAYSVEHKAVGSTSRQDDVPELLPWIGMRTADNKFVPWLASQTDLLSEDWSILATEDYRGSFEIQIPLTVNADFSLFDLAKEQGILVEKSDTVFKVDISKVVTKEELQVMAVFEQAGDAMARGITINGTFDNGLQLSLRVDPERWTGSLRASGHGLGSTDLYMVLSVEYGHFSRR